MRDVLQRVGRLIAVALALGLAGCASSPGLRIEAGTLLLAELRHPLTRAMVAAGEIAPGDKREQFAASLQRGGFTDAQIDAGQVWVVRDLIYWHNTASGIQHSRLGLTLADDAVPARPGQVVEMLVRDGVPSLIRRVRAPSLAEGQCFYDEVQGSVVKDLMGAISMVGPSGVASLYCRGIEREGWQRPRTLWQKHADAPPVAGGPPPAAPAPPSALASPGASADANADAAAGDTFATLLLTRNRALVKFMFSLPVWIDGQKVTSLDGGTCDIVRVPPGVHVVTVGTGELLGLPRRELRLSVQAGQHLVLAYEADQAKWDRLGIETLFKPREAYESEVFTFTQRAAGERDSCALRGPARVFRPAAQ